MGWSQTIYPATPVFVADWDSISRNTGGQIDWGQVPASYSAGDSGRKVLKAGTVLAQLANGKYVPRADRPGTEEAVGLLISTATENSDSDALTGYGILVGGVIYENLLPEDITTYKTELLTHSTGFVWVQYADGREA